jgi:hypothetical protein
MARLKLLGGETGDLSEIPVTSAGNAIDAVVFNSAGGGAYAYKETGTTGIYLATGLSLAHGFFKFYFRFDTDTTPGSQVFYQVSNWDDGTNLIAGVYITERIDGTFSFYTINSLGSLVDETVITIAKNTWYRIEIDLTIGSSTGAIKLYLDGVQKVSLTSQNFGANNITQWGACNNINNAGRSFWFDDIEADDAALPGAGYVIARQFKLGTPTYDTWVESSGTIDTVWSETPFSAASNATSSTLNDAQTALVAPLSSPQTGHGTGSIGSNDTINGAKAALVGKAASGSAASIRRRVGGVDTDTAITFTTSDAYYETAVFTATFNNLSNAEVGVLQGANAVLQTVEDAWLHVSYTPGATILSPQAIF